MIYLMFFPFVWLLRRAIVKKAESMLWGIDFKGLIKKIFKFQEVSGDLCVCVIIIFQEKFLFGA